MRAWIRANGAPWFIVGAILLIGIAVNWAKEPLDLQGDQHVFLLR